MRSIRYVLTMLYMKLLAGSVNEAENQSIQTMQLNIIYEHNSNKAGRLCL